MGDAPALISPEKTISHQEHLNQVERLSTGFHQRTLASGDRVCILANNSIEYFELLGACARLGAVAYPINWRLSPDEIQQILTLAEPKAIVADVPNLEKIAGLNMGTASIRALIGDEPVQGFEPLSTMIANDADLTASVSAEDAFVILTTAATEGTPRGAVLSHANLLTAGQQIVEALELTSQDRHLAALPLFHVTGLGLSLATLQAGGANVVLERFDPKLAVSLMDQYQVTLMASFPPVLSTVLDARQASGAAWESLKYVLGLDAPDVIQRLITETGAQFWTGFGQSETSGVVTLGNVLEKPGSAGKSLPAADVRIFDDQGAEVPVGSQGEIVVSGPLVFEGYWRDPDATSFASRHGWHHTGDLGRFDEEGYLFYLGRKPEKDLIKSGGENVYPAEVEFAILSLPQVSAACVIGVDDETWGEAVKAVVELKPGESLTSEEIVGAVVDQIAAYKKPRIVEFVDALPRTPENEIDRQAVKATFG
jgi:long-chain acyl-CoA synthetase